VASRRGKVSKISGGIQFLITGSCSAEIHRIVMHVGEKTHYSKGGNKGRIRGATRTSLFARGTRRCRQCKDFGVQPKGDREVVRVQTRKKCSWVVPVQKQGTTLAQEGTRTVV